jgi:hypothetical protein
VLDNNGLTTFVATPELNLSGFDNRCVASSGMVTKCLQQLVTARFNSPVGWVPTTTAVRIQTLTPNGTQLTIAAIAPSGDRNSIQVIPNRKILPDGDYRLTIPQLEYGDLLGNPMQSDVSFDFFALKGDVNHDRTVSIADFIQLSSNFNKSPAVYAEGDLNLDNVVSIGDFIDLSANLNRTLGAAPAPPQAAASVDLKLKATRPQDKRADLPRRHHHPRRLARNGPLMFRVRD